MATDGRLRIVVTGLLAQYPLGGVTWDYLQYVLGFHRLGHDVYYVEDTGQWPYNPSEGGVSAGCEFNVAYLDGVMRRFGLADRWAYRFPWQDQWFGLDDVRRRDVVATADLVVNVSGSLADPGTCRDAERLVFIDSDPVFTQLKLARGQVDFQRAVDLHDAHFTFGERLPDLDGASVPATGHRWQPTRQPIVLDEWRPVEQHRDTFTTVMNWTSYKPIRFEGRSYGQKDAEFRRFLDLPARVHPRVLELAVNAGKTASTPADLLRHHGWVLKDPDVVCPDLDSYRDYLRSSKAEWSVAKNGYVVGQAGWFSCRSACYLAAGRPVVVQDTGFGATLPTGDGLLSFRDIDEAVGAIEDVERRYDHHVEAAGHLAHAYFDSATVLTDLIERAGTTTRTRG